NGALLETLEKDPARAGAACAERCQQMQGLIRTGGINSLRPDELAPLFLVMAERRAAGGRQAVFQLVHPLPHTPVRGAPPAQGPPTPFRKLVAAWMTRLPDDYALGHVLSVMSSLNVPEVADVALKVVRDKKGGAQARGHALVILAKVDGKKHAGLIESFLT